MTDEIVSGLKKDFTDEELKEWVDNDPKDITTTFDFENKQVLIEYEKEQRPEVAQNRSVKDGVDMTGLPPIHVYVRIAALQKRGITNIIVRPYK